ncbi:MAG: O-antigen ligase family protein [Clostridia bacterium]|nr:O-antigen ligase family protein [Clostridia bacterium]
MYLKIWCKKESILFSLLLFPFFEPMLFGLLESNGINTHIWKTIGNIFLASRVSVIFISLFLFVKMLIQRKHLFDNAIICLIINILLWGASSFFNRSGDIKLWANVFQNIGFIIVCIVLLNSSSKCFFQASILLFGSLTIVGALSIFFHPLGYFSARTTNEAFYFLGGKNGSFPYYFFFFYSKILYDLIWKKEKPKMYFWLLLTITAAGICKSANSIICLLMILLCLMLLNSPKLLINSINPVFIFSIVVAFITMLYVGNVVDPLRNILNYFGKNDTFSGRDILWAQAFHYIISSPFWGVGNNAVFILRDLRDAGHAHSQYLHRLSLYGIIPFVFFVISIMIVLRKDSPILDKPIANTIKLLFIVYLFHMAFDTYPYYFPILLIMMGNASLNYEISAIKE